MSLKESIKKVGRRAAEATGLTYKLNELAASLQQLERQVNQVDRGTQLLLAFKYRELASQGIRCSFDDIEFRNYSQNGEDGILWYIFSIIGATTKTCVEMCAGSGQECNTSNLIINHGWTGLLFDGDEKRVQRGKAFFGSNPDTFIFPPKFVYAWITAENADALVSGNEYRGEIDLLSLDMDGVDYWIWDAIKTVSPRVVYRPIGCQRYGFNAVFLRNDVGRDVFPEVPASECFHHPFAKWAYAELRPRVAHKQWVEV